MASMDGQTGSDEELPRILDGLGAHVRARDEDGIPWEDAETWERMSSRPQALATLRAWRDAAVRTAPDEAT